MAGENMSEIPAIRNESRQETFSSSLKERFNFLQFYLSGIFSNLFANTSKSEDNFASAVLGCPTLPRQEKQKSPLRNGPSHIFTLLITKKSNFYILD